MILQCVHLWSQWSCFSLGPTISRSGWTTFWKPKTRKDTDLYFWQFEQSFVGRTLSHTLLFATKVQSYFFRCGIKPTPQIKESKVSDEQRRWNRHGPTLLGGVGESSKHNMKEMISINDHFKIQMTQIILNKLKNVIKSKIKNRETNFQKSVIQKFQFQGESSKRNMRYLISIYNIEIIQILFSKILIWDQNRGRDFKFPPSKSTFVGKIKI